MASTVHVCLNKHRCIQEDVEGGGTLNVYIYNCAQSTHKVFMTMPIFARSRLLSLQVSW